NGHRPDRPPPRFQGDPAFEALVEPRRPVTDHDDHLEKREPANGAYAAPPPDWSSIWREDRPLPVRESIADFVAAGRAAHHGAVGARQRGRPAGLELDRWERPVGLVTHLNEWRRRYCSSGWACCVAAAWLFFALALVYYMARELELFIPL